MSTICEFSNIDYSVVVLKFIWEISTWTTEKILVVLAMESNSDIDTDF